MPSRQVFDRQLDTVQANLERLGEMVCQAIFDALAALQSRDLDHARQVIDNDRHINDARFGIEEACLHMLATQQPAASDLAGRSGWSRL